MNKAKKNLIYAEECYQIVGSIFGVYNELGYGYKEAHYQKAIATEFHRNNIPFEEQLRAKLRYRKRK